jgi:HK97 family phage major capsid protein
MTPRVVPQSSSPLDSDLAVLAALSKEIRRQLARGVQTTFEEYRAGKKADPAANAFWDYATFPGIWEGDPAEIQGAAEWRVLSKAAGGGGFLVPTDLADMVVSAARSKSPIAQLAQEWVTVRGDTFGVPTAASHGSAAWVAESGAISPSDETITQISLGAFKANSKIIVSEELVRDEEVDLARFLATELGGRIGVLEAAAYATGDGSGKPTGAASAASTYTVSTAPTGNVTAYSKAAILQFYNALAAEYRAEASWIMHPTDFASLVVLEHASGGLTFPSLQNDPPTLFGRPVYIDAQLPTPAASAKSLLFGNMRLAYGVRRVREVSMARQDEIHADTGGVGFRLFTRVDGKPLLAAAAIIGAHSAT